MHLDQLQKDPTNGGSSIAGVQEGIAYHGQQQLQLLWQLYLQVLANASQHIEQTLDLKQNKAFWIEFVNQLASLGLLIPPRGSELEAARSPRSTWPGE